MKFTLGESVKLAAKGYKHADIAELSELDENKFSKEDILSLVGSGWSKSDIKKLVDDLSDPREDEEDEPDDSDESNNHKGNPEKKSEQDDPETDDSDEDESIDYKSLYEKEKKLREDLQHKNAKKGSADKSDPRTDEQVAIELATKIIS